MAVAREQQVGRTDVAVNDAQRLARVVAQRVRVRQRVRGLTRDVQRDVERHGIVAQRHCAQQLVDVGAVDELHGDEERAFVLTKVEHLHDVRVGQPRGEPRLVDEHVDEVGIDCELRQDALERHALLEAVRAMRLATKTSAMPPAPAGAPSDRIVDRVVQPSS